MSFLELIGTIILKYELIFREGDGAMKRIGLTGGIASGKSTASAILRGWGACIIDADMYQLAQIPLGQPIHFVACSLEEALKARADRQRYLEQLAWRLHDDD